MATNTTMFPGFRGFMCLGGKLSYVVAPELQYSIASGITVLGITGGGNTLSGVVVVGDEFTITDEPGGTTHTVIGSFYTMTNNAHTAISFTPEVTGAGAVGGKAVNFNSNAIGEVRVFGFTAEINVMDDTVQGDRWRTFKGGIAQWSGSAEMLLDYDDAKQKILIDSIAATTPSPSHSAIIFGNAEADLAAPAKMWFGPCVASNFTITQQVDDIVTVNFDITGTGTLRVDF